MRESEKKDFKDTIFLPRTDFPMKANLPELEPKIIDFWEKNKIYERALETKSEIFSVHDGPPYANGNIHLGHALNKIIKDITVKYNLIFGKKADFIPGWDCHGLPIEKEVEKRIGKNSSPTEIRKESRRYAENFIGIQREEFKRLGVFGKWNEPYITMSPDYEAMIIDSINEIWKKGRIYSSYRPVFWCPVCSTALAEAEVEYKTKKSPSIYFLFPAKFSEIEGERFEKLFAVVWTTTPWTIPANFALAFNPEINYIIAKKDSRYLIVAEDLASQVLGDFEKVRVLKGYFFEKKVFSHPLFDRDSLGVIAEFVSKEEGTGIVHIAPGHGEEDFEVGKRYGLPVESVLDEFGRGNENAKQYKSYFYTEINQKVIEDIEKKNLLLKKGEYEHSYPHCWRCKNPIVFRATKQWFIKVQDIKDKFIENIRRVKWIPDWGITRIESTVMARPDWCISRQRAWGVPIPYIICKNCGEYIWSEYTAEKIKQDILSGRGESWWEEDITYFIPENMTCPTCKSDSFEKGKDVLDVWIDSGLSFRYMKTKYGDNFSFPADVYIEGTDQHRGWFQSSLILSVILEGKAPYKSVFTHGFILDEFKRKMSKSLGNVVSPSDIIKESGAEIVRVWAVFSDPSEDVKISEKILSEVVDIYRKVRNTIRFMLGALGDNPQVVPEKFFPQDIYFLRKLEEMEKEIDSHYKNMEYHKVLRKVHFFADKILSGLFLDILKDTLYCDSPDSPRRLSGQFAIFTILKSFLFLISPVFSFLSEEAYQHLPEVFGFKKRESIFFELPDRMLISFSNLLERYENEKKHAEELFSVLIPLREKLNEVTDKMRKEKVIGSSLELKVFISLPDFPYFGAELLKSIVEELFIVSKVFITSGEPALLKVEKYSEARKCLRCWRYFEGENDLCVRCSDVVSRFYS